MNEILYVALGGAIGAAARHVSMNASQRLLGAAFPYGTMIVNIVGSLLMGLFIGWLVAKTQTDNTIRLFAAVGVLGGFTTFSAFSLDAVMLLERKAYGLFFTYISASVVLSILALMLGLYVMRRTGSA